MEKVLTLTSKTEEDQREMEAALRASDLQFALKEIWKEIAMAQKALNQSTATGTEKLRETTNLLNSLYVRGQQLILNMELADLVKP